MDGHHTVTEALHNRGGGAGADMEPPRLFKTVAPAWWVCFRTSIRATLQTYLDHEGVDVLGDTQAPVLVANQSWPRRTGPFGRRGILVELTGRWPMPMALAALGPVY